MGPHPMTLSVAIVAMAAAATTAAATLLISYKTWYVLRMLTF